MLQSRYAYLFTEIAGLLIAYTFTSPFVNWKILGTKAVLMRIGILFLIWILVDQIAVHLGIWTFSDHNSISILLLDLPVEEYAIFLLHSVYCIVFFEMYKRK